jgi:hypothetical protein
MPLRPGVESSAVRLHKRFYLASTDRTVHYLYHSVVSVGNHNRRVANNSDYETIGSPNNSVRASYLGQ